MRWGLVVVLVSGMSYAEPARGGTAAAMGLTLGGDVIESGRHRVSVTASTRVP